MMRQNSFKLYSTKLFQIASSDYENLSNKPSPIRQPSQSVTSITQKPFKQSPQKSHQFSNILPLKDEAKKSPIAAENTASFTPSRTIPTSQSYIISPNYQTASIISSPPPLSPTTFMSSSRAPTGASQSSAHIASIITNPSYYNTTNNSLNNVNYEYVRSPHGIYTRVNSSILPPQYDVKSSVKKSPSFRILPKGSGLNGHSSAQNIPQSTSSFIISSSALNKTNSNSKLLVSSTKSPSSSVIVHPGNFFVFFFKLSQFFQRKNFRTYMCLKRLKFFSQVLNALKKILLFFNFGPNN